MAEAAPASALEDMMAPFAVAADRVPNDFSQEAARNLPSLRIVRAGLLLVTLLFLVITTSQPRIMREEVTSGLGLHS